MGPREATDVIARVRRRLRQAGHISAADQLEAAVGRVLHAIEETTILLDPFRTSAGWKSRRLGRLPALVAIAIRLWRRRRRNDAGGPLRLRSPPPLKSMAARRRLAHLRHWPDRPETATQPLRRRRVNPTPSSRPRVGRATSTALTSAAPATTPPSTHGTISTETATASAASKARPLLHLRKRQLADRCRLHRSSLLVM